MLPEEICQEVEEIKTDKMRGASSLALKAVGAIKLLAEKSKAKKEEDLLRELQEIKLALIRARPEMTSVTNNVVRVIDEVLREYRKWPGSLRELIKSITERRIREYQIECIKAAKKAIGIIKDKSTVMTCSYSSVICNTLRMALEQKKRINILIAESKFGNKSYGKIILDRLNFMAGFIQLIPDDEIEKNIIRVTTVIVGADSVLTDGSLINGVPTLLLAKAAKRNSVPFYSVCETAKFDILGNLSKNLHPAPGFDLVPPQFITAFITEKGVIKPWQIAKEIKGIER